MKSFQETAIRYDGDQNQLWILDQQKLPHEETWLDCSRPEVMYTAIQKLKVRGAPLIGVSAALCLATFVKAGASMEEFREAARSLRQSRPTAVNLMWAIDLLLEQQTAEQVVQTAEKIYEEDVELCLRLGKHGADLIDDGDGILTHCNTGGLATAGRGTALSVIHTAHEQGKKIHVYVDETRPLLQGGRLTTWELARLGIPYTLICDNMASILMREKKIQKIFVGSDRIALNGDFANKVGTYGVAVSAHFHQVPFYPVAPYTTIDFEIESGNEIPIEERSSEEVKGVVSPREYQWAPEKASTFNPAFDVTPVDLISGLVLDSGVFSQAALKNGALKNLRPNLQT